MCMCVSVMKKLYGCHSAITKLPILFTKLHIGIWYVSLLKVRWLPCNGNHPRKKSFANFANLEAFGNVFLHFLSWLEFLYNEITWIAKVFSRTTAKKAIRKTFLPRMIPVTWYYGHVAILQCNAIRPYSNIVLVKVILYLYKVMFCKPSVGYTAVSMHDYFLA